jgi:hypothetical protein
MRQHQPIVEIRSVARLQRSSAKILFTIFVDAIFTTLFERLFTNSFDAGCEPPANACVYPPRTSD